MENNETSRPWQALSGYDSQAYIRNGDNNIIATFDAVNRERDMRVAVTAVNALPVVLEALTELLRTTTTVTGEFEHKDAITAARAALKAAKGTS